jgi:hypothetical protein
MAKHYLRPSSSTGVDQRIELHWQRDMGVQLGVATRPDSREQQDGSEDDWQVPQFVELSRDDINHLIKQLRIARDQAFGRDE